MCKPASFVLTKDRVFWSVNSDSHETIIREHELSEGNAARINILRVEITPPNDDFKAPLEAWNFRVDQDRFPKWHDPREDEVRARAELKKWFDFRVILEGVRKVRSGLFMAYGSSQVTAYGSSQVTAYDSSQVTAYGSSQVTAYGSSQVTAYGSSQVTARDSSQVTARDRSQVTARDSSQVTACEGESTTTRWSKNAVVAEPSGKLALVIDRTGEEVAVKKGE